MTEKPLHEELRALAEEMWESERCPNRYSRRVEALAVRAEEKRNGKT